MCAIPYPQIESLEPQCLYSAFLGSFRERPPRMFRKWFQFEFVEQSLDCLHHISCDLGFFQHTQ